MLLLNANLYSQEYGYGAIIDEERAQTVPIMEPSSLLPNSPGTQNIAYVSPTSVMLVTPPIGNQYGQSSCCAWAVGYAACGIQSYDRYGQDWDVARRSPSFLYNQLTENKNDCSTGLYLMDALDFVKNHGICSYKTMPYISNNCSKQPDSYQNYEASLTSFLYARVSEKNYVANIKSFLSHGYPVVFDFYVHPEYQNAANGNGIISSYPSSKAEDAHACCFIGYDDAKQMFKVQNSWGVNSGDNGFLWVAYSAIPNMVCEAYIVYPVKNSEYEFTIEGPDILCHNETYTIRNCPSTANVTWTIPRSNMCNSGIVPSYDINATAVGTGVQLVLGCSWYAKKHMLLVQTET